MRIGLYFHLKLLFRLLLVLANLATVVVLVAFALTTLVEEPGTTVALIVILVLGLVLDLSWKSRRGRASPAQHG